VLVCPWHPTGAGGAIGEVWARLESKSGSELPHSKMVHMLMRVAWAKDL
jgi:hypothetical protein